MLYKVLKNRMNNLLQLLYSNKKISFLFIFIIAFSIRFYFVLSTPNRNDFIDLEIYREGGKLVNNGINPYNFDDGKDIRNALRLDTFAYNFWVSETQERWDFYTSGNLPLSLIYYSLIDKISNGSAVSYRMIFSFLDALLSAFIAFLLLNYWQLNRSYLNLVLLLGIAALSPTLLLWGTIFSEDKGLQILFMLLGVYFAKEKRILLSSVFIGFSIAFKGLGFFMLPICLFFIIGEPENIWKINLSQLKQAAIYTLIVFTLYNEYSEISSTNKEKI